MNHGKGELVEENPDIGLRKRNSQSEKMAFRHIDDKRVCCFLFS